jgi:hypothetical protein
MGCVLGGLLRLPVGVEVELVEREADGSFSVHARTAAGVVVCCPACAAPSARVKEVAGQTVARLAVVPVRVTWHKHRFWCDNDVCGQRVFTESGALAARGGTTVSAAAKDTAGHLVGDWLVPVDLAARAAGIAWHTAHDGFVGLAEAAGIEATAPAGPALADDVPATEGDGLAGEHPGPDPGPGLTRRSVHGPLPAVRALGIDDHRRGRPRYHRDPVTGRWVEDADRWQTGFYDSTAGHGLLGAVEGRTASQTAAWILAQPAPWWAGIDAVTIDMSTIYKSAARQALPHAMIAVDPFHVAQLANKAVGDVRRRITDQLRHRRGRATDPEYTIKDLLLRGPATLTDRGREKILTTLADLGGEEAFAIGAAWRAKNLLLDLLALSPARTGLATTRTDLNRA